MAERLGSGPHDAQLNGSSHQFLFLYFVQECTEHISFVLKAVSEKACCVGA